MAQTQAVIMHFWVINYRFKEALNYKLSQFNCIENSNRLKKVHLGIKIKFKMQRGLSLLAAAILAYTPTRAIDVELQTQTEAAAEDFRDSIDYIRYKPVNDFTFNDPNYDEYEVKLSIFQRGLAIYMSRLI